MALTLFDRIATLLRADAHGVVESLEERSLLLKQHLREAELAFDEHTARRAALQEEAKALHDELARRDTEVRALDEDVTLALAAGKDDLARFAVRRLLPQRRELAALRTRLAEREAQAAELGERVERQRTQLDALRVRVRAALATAASHASAPPWCPDDTVAEEDIDLEIMRRRAGQQEAS